MVTAKKIIIPGVYTALLIGGQLALSGVSGIEIVTILFLVFCFTFGVKQGLLVANTFTILRCFIFGFMLPVLILYFIYYNLFALIFGTLGNLFKREYSVKSHAIVLVVAVLITALFTILDNVITPIFYGFSLSATKGYFIASLYTLVPHLVCVFVTTLFLFLPLVKVLKRI